MRKLYYFFAAVTVIITLMILDQVWFDFVSPEYFWKVLFTLLVASIGVLVVVLIWQEFVNDKKMRDDKYID